MPRVCKCCSHDDRDLIDSLIVQGVPNRRIAAQFSISEQSVRRHKKSHLPDTLLASKQAEDLTRADALVERILKLLQEAQALLEGLKQQGDLRGAISSIGELRRIIELIAKIGAEAWERQAINIHRDPAWVELRTLIITSLEKYPEARDAVITALKGTINDQL